MKARGERAEARLWPTVDHYGALEPDRDQQHPIDALIDRTPAVRRARGRVLQLEKKIRLPDESAESLFRELCDARLLLESLQAELAFNIGVDLGTAAGRQNAARSLGPDRRSPARTLRSAAQALLLGARFSPAERLLALIEAAWSLAAGPVPVRSNVGGHRSGRRRSIGEPAPRTGHSKTASR